MDALQARGLELLRAADLVTPMAIRAAATLRLADHVASGVTTPEALAVATGCQPRPLRKLLDHLCALGVLRAGPGGTVEIGDLGTPLLSAHDHLGIRPFLDVEHVLGRAEMALVELLHTLRTGASAYEGQHGRNLWDDLDRCAGAQGMEAFARPAAAFDADLVIHGYDWSSAAHVVDVGGNGGALLAGLLRAHPHLRGTLLDLPCFADIARGTMRQAGLADRCTVVGGSFFDPLPHGADVYLVSAILADWDDEQATAILRRCAEAAGGTGAVLLAEVHLSAAHEDPIERTAVSLRLEASMGDPDRSVDDLEKLARKAGLDVAWRGAHSQVRSLLELRPVEATVRPGAR